MPTLNCFTAWSNSVRGQAAGDDEFSRVSVARLVRAGRLQYVLEDFGPGPLLVHFLYPHSRIRSPTVRAFADLCVKKLRHTRFD